MREAEPKMIYTDNLKFLYQTQGKTSNKSEELKLNVGLEEIGETFEKHFYFI